MAGLIKIKNMKRVTILIVILVFPLLTFSQVSVPKKALSGSVEKFEYTPKVKNRVEIVNLLGEVTGEGRRSKITWEQGRQYESWSECYRRKRSCYHLRRYQ